MSLLYLVRHGESVWNREGKLQGQAESPLTERGIDQAHVIGRYLGRLLSGCRLDIYSSPLSRAVQTASVIGGYLGHDRSDIRVDQRINDFNLGVLSGYPGWDPVARDYPELAWMRTQDPFSFHPPEGESGADMDARVRDFLDCLPPGRVALVVSHGVVNKFIRSARRGLSGAEIIALDEGQYTVYRLDGFDETAIELEPLSTREDCDAVSAG